MPTDAYWFSWRELTSMWARVNEEDDGAELTPGPLGTQDRCPDRYQRICSACSKVILIELHAAI